MKNSNDETFNATIGNTGLSAVVTHNNNNKKNNKNMEFKGTKGKWEQITTNWDLDQEVFLQGTEIRVAKVFGKPHEQRYNALLISKAPEMLEMLKRCESRIPNIGIHESLLKDLNQLIKDATEL